MNWPLVTLSDVADVESGDPAPQGEENFADSGTPFVRAGSLVPLLDGSNESDLEHIPESVSAKLRMKTYPANTVVFAKSGMSCTKGLIYQLRSRAHVVSHLAAIVCREGLSPKFLRRWYQVNSPTRLIDNPSYPSM